MVKKVKLEKAILSLCRDWNKHPELRRLLIQLKPSLKDPWPTLLDKLFRYYTKRGQLILRGELLPDPWDIATILGLVAAGVTISHGILHVCTHILRHFGVIGPSREEIIEKKIDALAVALGVEDKYRELLEKEKIIRPEVRVIEKPILYKKRWPLGLQP